tara:strand:+ start:5396 stop:5743 length:348 start_codon:yes stop_codon:yes gene_type:complete
MEEVIGNITQDEVLEVIGRFPIDPLHNRIVISVNVDESDDLDLEGSEFGEIQYVIAKGDRVSDSISLGCKVILDLGKMSKETESGVYEINIKPIKVGERVYGIIYDNAVICVDNR